jgi:hypothetical protein
MSAPKTIMIAVAASLIALFAFAGCGSEEHELEVNEGQPLHLGDVKYNVQITRFLNPFSPEDAQYLEGAPELEGQNQWLGVFVEIENEGDEESVVPYPFKVVDTRGNVYEQVPGLDNPFVLVSGTPIPPDGEVPEIETAAANGPIEGSLILFEVPETAESNRPVQLVVPGPGEPGKIELDL